MNCLPQYENFRARMRRLIASWSHRAWYAPQSEVRPYLPLRPLLRAGASLYGIGLRLDQCRSMLDRRSLPVYVISVGNLVAGGTGKTPFVLWLSRFLRGKGLKPAVLSRGYGRSGEGVGRAPSTGATRALVRRFGDEPVLMARSAAGIDVYVGRDRWTAGQLAIEQSHSDVLILDDAFQHVRLVRDLDIVLLDAANPFGNGALLPLGPLREPVEHLERADMIVLTRADDPEKLAMARLNIQKTFPDKPLFACRHRLKGLRVGLSGERFSFEGMKDRPVVAFAGIARPDVFFRSLEAAGMRLAHCLDFPDHHNYRLEDIECLTRSVTDDRAEYLVTTEKDMVRLPAFLQKVVLATEMELDFGLDQAPLCAWLDSQLLAGMAQPKSSSG